MSGSYSPTTVFGFNSSIGRKQYLVSLFYQSLVVACSLQFEIMKNGKSPVVTFVLDAMAFSAGIAAFVMMMLAIKSRLFNCGMSSWWLGIPFFFLALELLRFVSGSPASVSQTTSPFSFSGLLFLAQLFVVALLFLLMFVPSRTIRNSFPRV